MGDSRTSLLERERELALIDDRLGAANSGHGGVVVVRGAMGTGKTRLLDAVRERAAAAGVWVLSARAGELEQAFSFGLARQLLAPALQRLDDDARSEVLSGAARLSAGVLFEPESDPPPGDEDAAYRVLHGLYWLCVELAIRRPLLLTVDDAHWGDSASLRWLNYLVRRIAGVPVTLVIATRAPAGPPLQLLAALETLPDVEVLELAGLSSGAVGDLLERVLGGPVDEAVGRAAFQATGGNPLLVEALARAIAASPADALRAIEESGPAAVERQVRERLAALGPEVGALSAALAVLGAAATVERAAGLAELSRESAGACRDTLFRAGLVGAGVPITFVHPLLRTAVLAGLEPSQRSRLHRRAAELLATGRASPDEIAVHLLQVDPAGESWVTARLRDAARAARAAGAPESAVSYLRRALAECSSVEVAHVLEELGQAEAQAGFPEAPERLRAAREAALEPAQRTRLALLEAGARAARADIDPALDLLEATLEDPDTTDPDLRAHLQAWLVTLAAVGISSRPRLLDGVTKLRRAQPPGSGAAARIFSAAITMENLVADDVERAVVLARTALEDGQIFRELPLESPPVTLAINTLAFADLYDEALAAWEHVLSAARTQGSALAFGVASTFRAVVRLRMGELRDAEADARAGQELLTDLGAMVPASIALGTVLLALADQGALAEADAELGRWPLDPAAPPFGYLLFARGTLRAAQGRWAEAIDDTETYGRRVQAWRMESPAVFAWRAQAALAHRGAGDHETARALAADELERAQAAGTPRARGLAARAAGLIEGGEPGRESVEQSIELFASCGARMEQARALVDHGSALRRMGRRQSAQDGLRAGLDLADRCGARPLAQLAREELRAAGARPRRARLSGVDALTASELRVARMAASGMTNREIAQGLFVTLKAVEKHLSAAFGKLGVQGRRELGAVLEPPGSGEHPITPQ